jgi:dCMP deaminase
MSNRKIDRTRQKVEVFVKHLKNIAELSQSSSLKVGAIAVKKNFQRDCFGYNGAISDAPINEVTGTEEESLVPGKSGFVHAEMNLIAKFREHDPENYVVILTHSPCTVCAKLLINAEFKNVFWLEDYRETDHLDRLFKERLSYYGKIEELLKSPKVLNVFDS